MTSIYKSMGFGQFTGVVGQKVSLAQAPMYVYITESVWTVL